MTCIDAAIIKALVEHIGMNPDDVGTTTGASSLLERMPGRFEIKQSEQYGTTVLELIDGSFTIGDIIKISHDLKAIYNGEKKNNYFLVAGAKHYYDEDVLELTAIAMDTPTATLPFYVKDGKIVTRDYGDKVAILEDSGVYRVKDAFLGGLIKIYAELLARTHQDDIEAI